MRRFFHAIHAGFLSFSRDFTMSWLGPQDDHSQQLATVLVGPWR